MTETKNTGKVLNACVHVENPETGQTEVFGPPGTVGADGVRVQSDVPDWAREAITNPNVWVDPDDEDETPIPGPSQSVYFDLEEGGEGEETEGSDQTPGRARSRARAKR
jgi:hypothetical protein